MTRNEFIKVCGILGISLPFQTMLSSCEDENSIEPTFSGKTLIIGAGAAGLTAGYLLEQRGLEFQILEASSSYGGRIKRTNDFADFPIPLGAEWLHVSSNVFDQIVNNSSVEVTTETVGYNADDSYGWWENGQLTLGKLGNWEDRKFVNGSWLDFFDQYIVPSISENILLNKVVQSLDYSGDQVLVNTQNEQYSADKVIVTVPLKILQEGDIIFSPQLSDKKLDAINKATVWDGIKVFIEFSEKFYPTATEFNISPTQAGQKLFYDAAYGQNSSKNILGLFAVGSAAQEYISLSSEEIKNNILAELDLIFSGEATPSYIKHIVQNWSEEPFAKGAYLYDHENSGRVRTLSQTVDDKVYFAGEAYTSGNDWGGCHAAALAAKERVEELIR